MSKLFLVVFNNLLVQGSFVQCYMLCQLINNEARKVVFALKQGMILEGYIFVLFEILINVCEADSPT